MVLCQIVESLSRYWCKFGRMLFVDEGSDCDAGTGSRVEWSGSATRGRGGGLVSDEALVSSSEFEHELHEHDSEHSESGTKR